MAFTKHGHHIPGTDMHNKPADKARCGGLSGFCLDCSHDVLMHNSQRHEVPPTPEETTTKVLLEYLVRDLKHLKQTRTYIPIEDVVVSLERIIHH